jgi:putative nucleotidyltransferase with HDIG domain
MANSALYAPSVPIVSIPQALSRLGREAVRQMALIVATQTAVFRVDGHKEVVRAMFRQAFASALYAQEIARLRRWNVEEAFLCGLFHDIARPVLLQALVDLCRAERCAFDAADAATLIDGHHEPLGATIVASWSQPSRVAMAIRFHHDPAAAGEHARAAHLVALADTLAQLAVDPKATLPEGHPALEPLGLYPEDVQALVARRTQIAAAVQGAS